MAGLPQGDTKRLRARALAGVVAAALLVAPAVQAIESDWLQVAPRAGRNDRIQALSVAVSPDGKRLASGHGDGTVVLWDPAATPPVVPLKAHKANEKVFVVAFSPDGKQLASGSGDMTVKLWDVATRQVRTTLEEQSNWVRTLQYTPDGKRLVVGCNDFTLRVYNALTGKLERELAGDTNVVGSFAHTMAVSPDGKHVAAVARDFSVVVWQLTTGKKVATLPRGMYHHVAISPDGKRLVTVIGDLGGPVQMWELPSGKELPFTMPDAPGYVFSLGFTPDGKRLAIGSTNFISFADAHTGKSMGTLGPAHDDWIDSLTYSRNGKVLAMARWRPPPAPAPR